MKERFVHELSLVKVSAERACQMYEDLCREYGWENVRHGPAYDSVRKTFSAEEANVGFYVVKDEDKGEPSLEAALRAVERRGLPDCQCHR